MRIATWNLWRPARQGERLKALHEQITAIDADVWILTETRNNVSPGSRYRCECSRNITVNHRDGESRTAVWSRLPIVQKIETHDEDTAVCIEIESPFGNMLVYGTIIPYGGAGGKLAYRSSGEDRLGAKGWALHYASIEQHRLDLLRLVAKYPDKPVCFAGDFNQSRDNRLWGETRIQWYGTQKGRTALSNCLTEVGLKSLTDEDFVAAGKLDSRSSVDHICVSDKLAQRCVNVGAWEARTATVAKTSDHNGVYADFN